MMHLHFAPELAQAMQIAGVVAAQNSHSTITPEHVLFSLFQIARARTPGFLAAKGLNPDEVLGQVQERIQNMPHNNFSNMITAGPELATVFAKASTRFSNINPNTIDEVMFLEVLLDDYAPLRDVFTKPTSAISGELSPSSILMQVGIDLVTEAEQGRLDPVIGRQNEVARIIEVLARKSKNNPVLIGEPGVGKSAIVEALAQKIRAGDVPNFLKSARLISIDASAFLAGTAMRGSFEERLRALIKEVEDAKGRVILFVDEIHLLTGGGRQDADVAQVFKPALARGRMRLIGATTRADWKKSIERDAALVRRLQQVQVEESTPADTLKILHGLRSAYETHHEVLISDAILEEAVRLSARYARDRFFPDKALDLIDEAAARMHTRASPGERPELTPEVLTEIVSAWSGIPVGLMSQNHSMQLKSLAERLKARVIGQDNAVDQIARAVIRHRAGVSDPNRPAGVFLLAGPTGVGKTELARSLAKELYGDINALTRIDFSEYQEQHSLARLIGSPPGYVGHDEGGSLVESIKKRPHQVLLLDEVEKAHPRLLDLFLQVFDDGILTDGQGRTASFRDVVILLTTNMGLETRNAPIGFGAEKATHHAQIADAIKERLRPEFRNRLDAVVVFDALSRDVMKGVVQAQLRNLGEILENGRRISLNVTQPAQEWFAQNGFSAQFGARPLKRLLNTTIQDQVAHMLLDNQLKEGDRIMVDTQNNEILVSKI